MKKYRDHRHVGPALGESCDAGIGGRHRLYLRQEPPGDQGHQHESVQVAVVVGYDDGRDPIWEPFAMADVEPEDGQHDDAYDDG